MDVSSYFTCVKILQDKLKAYQQGMDYSKWEAVMQLLMGLNESFVGVCS